MKRATAFILYLLLVCGAAVADASEAWKSGLFDPPRLAPDFALQGSNGAPIKMSQFRGKVVALAFGFTYCPRICPVTLANLTKVAASLDATATANFQVVFVTVDPDRDSPARMREFLDFFNPKFLGATGTAEQLEAVQKAYGIMARRALSENKKLGYEVHHSSFIYLIDQEGQLRLLVPFGKPPEDVAHDVRLLLKK
jgi:protein SCO1/2